MLFLRVNYPWGGHQPSPLEREQAEMRRAERRAQAKILKEQQAEVKYFLKAIPIWLAKMGWAYWYKKSEKDMMTGQFLPVKLNMAVIGPDAYYFRINTKNLPRGVFLANLRDEKTIENLSAAAGSEVRYFTNETGSWYSVETKYGRGNIPVMVGYAEMLKLMPKDAPPLTFLLGLGANRRPHFGDLDKQFNLLIGGTKNGGKSNEVNAIICNLISRNAPNNLRLFLTDLKGGIEFADYAGIPHLGGDVYYVTSKQKDEPEENNKKSRPKRPEIRTVDKKYIPLATEQIFPPRGQQIITEPADVLPILEYAEAELDRRARLLAGHVKNLPSWNNKYPDKSLSTWIIIIDEQASLMEDPRYKKQAVLSMAEIGRKGRAVGIYLISATQTPTSDIVPGQISNNMDCRLAFRCGTGVASGVLLGTGEYYAAKLPNIPGRFIFKWGGEMTEIQAPFITDSTVKHIVNQARQGLYTDVRQAELAQKADFVFRTAITTMHGECTQNRLWEFIKGNSILRSEFLRILSQYQVDPATNKPEIVIDNETYILAPGIESMRISRWLVPVADWKIRRHPIKNYNFDFAVRGTQYKISPEPGNTENQILTFTEPILPEIEIAESAVLALPPPSQPPPNGKNGHKPRTGAPQIEEMPEWLESLK
jgi:hypothetical protein